MFDLKPGANKRVWVKKSTFLLLFFLISIAQVNIANVFALNSGNSIFNETSGSGLQINSSSSNTSLANFSARMQPTLAPIVLFHFENNQTSLPGPRYMAFGPSVI